MAYEDLRSFIAVLEAEGELLRIPIEVDWEYELGGWIRKSVDMRPKGPALLFENIKGYSPEQRVFSCGVDSYPRFALALGLPKTTHPREIIDVFRERLKKPISPTIVGTGPVKENILIGRDVDLYRFPVPIFSPRDGGRYIGTWCGIISKSPDSRTANSGMYRVMVHDRTSAGIGFLPFSHLGYHYSLSERANKPLELAIVIGADEVVSMVAAMGFPHDRDEMHYAGALREAPVKLVKCETVDLEVPANAEIVIEGVLLPRQRRPEGPFSEHTGYHGGPVRMRPIFQVTAILHRNDPISRVCMSGKPSNESHSLTSISFSSAALDMFDRHGPPGVTSVFCPPEGDPAARLELKPVDLDCRRNREQQRRSGELNAVPALGGSPRGRRREQAGDRGQRRIGGRRECHALCLRPRPQRENADDPGDCGCNQAVEEDRARAEDRRGAGSQAHREQHAGDGPVAGSAAQQGETCLRRALGRGRFGHSWLGRAREHGRCHSAP